MKSEDNLLSLIIHNQEYFKLVSEIDDLFTGHHRLIFNEMKSQNKFDENTLFDSLNNKKIMSMDFFFSIADIHPPESNFNLYYDSVLFDYSKRKIREISINVNNYKTSYDLQCEVTNIFDKSYKEENEIMKASEVCKDLLGNMIPNKIYSGIEFLQDNQNGYNEDELIFLAARTGQGKTSKCLELIKRQLKNKLRIGFITAEMGNESIMRILACSIAGIDKNLLDRNELDKESEAKLTEALEWIYNQELYLDQSKNIESIIKKIKVMKKRFKIDCVYVDHIHHLNSSKNFFNEVQKLKYMTGELKQSARELKTPHVVLAQLNRGTGDRPVSKDLKGCGDLEEYADIIILMNTLQDCVDGDYSRRLIEVIIDKNRNGKIGTYKRLFQTDVRRYVRWYG